jgi:ankyrin repeat protein
LKINYKHDNDQTALHIAALLGNDKIVQLLVDNNADINALTEKQETPLILAAKK